MRKKKIAMYHMSMNKKSEPARENKRERVSKRESESEQKKNMHFFKNNYIYTF